MTKYRKKPVVIEAVVFPWADGTAPDWIRDAAAKPMGESGAIWIDPLQDGALFIRTLEGVHRADPGDYIICGIKGELYPCKPDIFAATYDVA